jgi:hypothetical protein
MYLKEMRKKDVEWIHLTQDRDKWRALVDTIITFQLPRNAGKFLIRWSTVSFSRRSVHIATILL